MARNPKWMTKLLHGHRFQPNWRYPPLIHVFPHNMRMRRMPGKAGDLLMKELAPKFAEELKRRESECYRLMGEERRAAMTAVDRWLDQELNKHPSIRRRYLKRRYEEETEVRHMPHQGLSQITAVNRHNVSNRLIIDIIKKSKLNPKSFLDVGAAFHPEMSNDEIALVPAQTTVDTKSFFDGEKVPLAYTAVDVIPITKEAQRKLLQKHRVKAFQQDYRKNKIPGKYDIIRIANVSTHMRKKEFENTLRNLFEALEPSGLLVVVNRTVSGPPIEGYATLKDEIGIYQKVRIGNSWTLTTVHYQKG